MAMENIRIPSPSSSSSSLLSPLPSPPVAWHNFLERMRHPSAAGFVKSIKSFIVSFSSKVPDPEKDSASVQRFLANMEAAFKAHMLWATSSGEELESASEGLEKYVMTKLFNRAFASLPEDVQSDEELFEKIALLQQFVRPENLDIKPAFQNETAWLLAEKELQKINMYKAPRDKLMCILNCCKVINNLLLNASVASDNNPPGADDFLPVLIYVTIKANPPQLHSNLVYIQRYRRQSQLVSEAAYYFTNILSAEAFLWNIDAHSLSMDEVEFQMKLESARAHYLGLSTHIESPTNIDNQNPNEQSIEKSKETGNHMSIGEHYDIHQVHKESKDEQILDRPSISSLEEKGVTELLKDEQFSSYFHEYPYLHANVGDLTINDVHSLLDGYKKVVLMYVTLSKGIQVSSNRPDSSTVKESENGTGKVINGG